MNITPSMYHVFIVIHFSNDVLALTAVSQNEEISIESFDADNSRKTSGDQ